MTNLAHLPPQPAPIVACTVSRDVQTFDLLIEDMEALLGESWGDLSFADALLFLDQPDARHLEFIALAFNEDEAHAQDEITTLITKAKALGIKVILITEQVAPATLHQLLQLGANSFLPYPLPEGSLGRILDGLRTPQAAPAPASAAPAEPLSVNKPTPTPQRATRKGTVLAVHGMGGGVGASTFAVNLAWELAMIDKVDGPRVCVIDLDLQFGSVATYLDLPRRDQVFDILSDTSSMDDESLGQALSSYHDRLQVFTAPPDMLPLDYITSEDVNRLLTMARAQFDYVIVDLPKAIVQWTEAVLTQCTSYIALIDLDMRSAQNTLRMIRALKAEGLAHEKMRFGLNRAPGFTDLSGKSRAKRLAESLSINIEFWLPDGGKAVTQSNDHGEPLSLTAGKNPLRKDIQKIAQRFHEDLRPSHTAASR